MSTPQNSPEFNLQEHLAPYIPQLLEKGISTDNAMRHLQYSKTLEDFRRNIEILLDAVVLPPLSESGEYLLNDGIRNVAPYRD